MIIIFWKKTNRKLLQETIIFPLFQSATALLKTAVHDDDAVVRKTATNVLEKHPKSKNMSREQEDIVLRY